MHFWGEVEFNSYFVLLCLRYPPPSPPPSFMTLHLLFSNLKMICIYVGFVVFCFFFDIYPTWCSLSFLDIWFCVRCLFGGNNQLLLFLIFCSFLLFLVFPLHICYPFCTYLRVLGYSVLLFSVFFSLVFSLQEFY